MDILTKALTIDELKQIAAHLYGEMVKAVVDVDRELIAVDAELHCDLEALLLEDGSKQKNLWGINLYPELQQDALIEFDSLINVRPSQENMSRGVENEATRQSIVAVVKKWISV